MAGDSDLEQISYAIQGYFMIFILLNCVSSAS